MSTSYKFPSFKLTRDVPEGRTPLVLVACGSYNPIHVMHLRMFEEIKNNINTDGGKLFVVGGFLSPVNDGYKKKGLYPFQQRSKMCELATESSDWLCVDPWEGQQEEYQRTFWVLQHFKEELSKVYDSGIEIRLLCGTDLLASFTRPGVWVPEMVQQIFKEYGLAVMQRPGFKSVKEILETEDGRKVLGTEENLQHALETTVTCEGRTHEVSSTLLRENFYARQSNKYLMDDNVLSYIYDSWNTSTKLYYEPPKDTAK